MKATGGYFELELSRGNHYHCDAIRVNTGRNAFQYILQANNYSKVYLPYYTCDVMLQPIEKLNLVYEFYTINQSLEPVFDYNKIKEREAFLYTNYFGLKDDFIARGLPHVDNIIIDNSQSFFSMPLNDYDSFYSPRKFFGVADGAYLYCKKKLPGVFAQDHSYDRMQHLLKRADTGAESGYADFIANDKLLDNMPILQMSELTSYILRGIEYNGIAVARRANFEFLDNELGNTNQSVLKLNNTQVPLTYPYVTSKSDLRSKLISQKIFTAKYWPNVLNWVSAGALESGLTENTIHLPIDQRYTVQDMQRIVKTVTNG